MPRLGVTVIRPWLVFGLLATVAPLAACGEEASSTEGAGGSGGETSGAGASGATSSTSGGEGGTGAAGGATGVGGSGGTGGRSPCTPVTMGPLIVDDVETGGSSLAYELQGLEATLEHVLYVEFYDVAGPQAAMSYDLSQAPNDNYATCAQCLLAFVDVGGSSTPYFPVSGTLNVTTPDVSYSATSAGTFMNVQLAQVTLNGTTTELIPGGDCLLLSGSWSNP